MKRAILFSIVAVMAWIGIAHADQFISYWPFSAPRVSDHTSIDPTTAGDIAFNTTADKFYGYNGSGWVELAGTSNPLLAVSAKTANYTVTSSDDFVTGDATGGAITFTLFTAVGNAGKVLEFKKTDSGLNAITIDPNSSETVDGASTTTLNTEKESIKIVSDGSNWIVMSRQIPTIWTSYTPTFTNAGTVSAVDFKWARIGSTIQIIGTVTTGGVQGSEARMSLPSGLTTPSWVQTLVPASSTTYFPSTANTGWANNGTVLMEPSVGYVTFQTQSSATLGKGTGSNVWVASTQQVLNFSVPVSGWN